MTVVEIVDNLDCFAEEFEMSGTINVGTHGTK